MRVRALSPDYDMTFGRGQASFLRDTPAAVAQNALTRLELFTGEWFLNTSDGTPWRTQVLGKRTEATRDPAMRARLLGTPGVTSLASYASQTDRQARSFAVQATLNTIYGQATVATPQGQTLTDVRFDR